jgi:type II secretory pathway component GspD/PulD (secretin)
VTSRLYDVKSSKALQVILDSVSTPKLRLGYSVDEGVVTVTTVEEIQHQMISTRLYDIRDLLVQPPDADPQPGVLGLSPTTRPADTGAARQNEQNRLPPKTRDELVKDIVHLVTDTVATDTWKENGGSIGAIKELSGQLIVNQTPENHRLLATLLEQLRETKGIQVTVEARFVTCDEDVLGRLLKEWGKAAPAGMNPTTLPELPTPRGSQGRVPTGVFLDDKQVDQLLRVARAENENVVVSAPRMTLFNGQRAYVLASTQQPYVQDYAAIARGGEVRYEPAMGIAEMGVLTDIQATVSADRHYATLTIHPKLTTLVGMNTLPWPGRPAGSNLTVQVPDMKTTEMRTTVSVPDGGTVLLGGLEYPGPAAGPTTGPSTKPATTRPERNMVLLVKPRLLLQRERAQREFPLLAPATTRAAQ